MGRDGAEGAAAKASAMDVDGELNHVEGWDALALVFRVRQSCVGQVVGSIELFGREWRKRRVDHHEPTAHLL